MTKSDLVLYRASSPSDEAFISLHWLKSLRADNDFFRLIPRELYYKKYREIIQLLLSRSEAKIACLKEDPDVILGFSVTKGDQVHWLYVKEDWRTIGIGRDLLPVPFKSYSHISHLGIQLLQSKFAKVPLIFNPFL